MFSLFRIQEKQILIGNILFIVCCSFYLAWWSLAFKPSGAIKGVKTGWLLIPAFIVGLSGVILIVRGILAKTHVKLLFPNGYIIWGGIAVYIILLVITVLLLKRQATSELLLIVGWGVLALAEINALFGSGLFSHRLSAGLILLICTAVLISLICYILYYRLNGFAAYIDGMIPLILSALTVASISFFIVAGNCH